MNKLHEAVYIGSRNFCRQHTDIFVFSEFDWNYVFVGTIMLLILFGMTLK